ncbi:hypothetical protein LTT66_23215 [Nocardia gipuzkoensis]|uniref:hypothetical protein n=1 Tax=Nocardia TaxID=1817 RepID=UPI001E35B695|nr:MULTISPECIES: hypothetical protein [Nocardia]MDE1668356.1 hypothetical protein [Nocardia gipuzkoensis]UGT66200.1 hypothetical protein LTT66_23215 [Nocardia gipuzkoensis]
MAIEVVSASTMTSDETSHMARCVGGDRWVVSWLPGRTLTGRQAVTAMTIASIVATSPIPSTAEWAMLDDLALVLGLTANEAVFMVAAENRDYRKTVKPRRRVLD